MTEAARPIIYGVHAHVWLNDLARTEGRRLTFSEVPDSELDRLARLGVTWFWPIGAWQTGHYGRSFAMHHPEVRPNLRKLLKDCRLTDILGSVYAVNEYRIHDWLGGDAALKSLRERLAQRGIKLLLDLVPNHTACDHPWTREHPEYYVAGDIDDLETKFGFWTETRHGDAVLRFGKDPYFAPWEDTAQLDWRKPEVVEAMAGEVERMAGMCDGLRCDMAMLVLANVFEKTWGKARPGVPAGPWTTLIGRARARNPDFLFLAEVYWGLEERLLGLGFDWVYDKVLYDRLKHDDPWPVREHITLMTDGVHERSMRFLENHDEVRASVGFAKPRQMAAAVIAATLPGPFFLHHGQMEGRTVKLPVQLARGPEEEVDEELKEFYERLLPAVRTAARTWQRFECRPGWEGNPTWGNVVAHGWSDADAPKLIATVNFSNTQSQAYVDLARLHWPDGMVNLVDVLSGEVYPRKGSDIRRKGLFVDLAPWSAHVFRVEPH